MTGLSGTPNRQPREKPKAQHSAGGDSDRTFGRERLALRTLFAAKIAAAYLYASKRDVVAIVAALRAEERAMVSALQRRKRTRAGVAKKWSEAARVIRDRVKPLSPKRFRLRRKGPMRTPV
jgi:hypothetical protein